MRTALGIGEIGASNTRGDIIMTYGLGSCVAVVCLHPPSRSAGMAHIALPESRIKPDEAKRRPGYFAARCSAARPNASALSSRARTVAGSSDVGELSPPGAARQSGCTSHHKTATTATIRSLSRVCRLPHMASPLAGQRGPSLWSAKCAVLSIVLLLMATAFPYGNAKRASGTPRNEELRFDILPSSTYILAGPHHLNEGASFRPRREQRITMSKISHIRRKARVSWKVLVALGLMLAAMLFYVMSLDEEYPGGIIDDPALERHSAPVEATDAAE